MSARVEEAPGGKLLDLVIDLDWDGVVEHAKRHPEDARWEDGDSGETPLYAACSQNPPVRVVQALIQAYPDACGVQTRNRDTPLHVACKWRANAEVLTCLVNHHVPVTINAVLQPSKWGKTPLHALAESMDNPNNHDSPQEHWEKAQILLKAATLRQGSLPALQMVTPYHLKSTLSRTQLLPNVNGEDTIMGTHRTIMISRSKDEDNWLALHAAVGLSTLMLSPTGRPTVACGNSGTTMECPKQILELALNMCPHEAAMCNVNSRHPLHLACASGSPHMIQDLLVLYPEAARTRDDPNRFALHWACASPHRRRRRLRNHNGEQSSDHDWIAALELLILANPHALTSPDPMTQLLPFMLAAASSSSSSTLSIHNNSKHDSIVDMRSLDTCYSLLVCQPDVLFPYLTHNDTRNKHVSNSMCLASRKHDLLDHHERTDRSSVLDHGKNELQRLGDRLVKTIHQFFTRDT